MATREDVYSRFGEVSEVAQLLETQLGTLLMMRKYIDEDLLGSPDRNRAIEIYDHVNRKTLGGLIRTLGTKKTWVRDLEQVFNDALLSRNQLAHSFYLKHNMRMRSEAGRKVMLNDLAKIEKSLQKAYWIAQLLGSIELESLIAAGGKNTEFEEKQQKALKAPYLPIRT